MLKFNFDENVTKNIAVLMKKYKIPNQVIEALLDLRPSTISELLNGRLSWKLKHIARLSIFFAESVDNLVFNDKNFIENISAKFKNEMKQSIKDYLIENRKYETLGKLEAINFFNEG